MVATAATFMPISYSSLLSLRRSQFLSVVVDPKLMPRICVCTAPDAPTIHRSLLMLVIAGAIALGGGLYTVVVDSLMVRALDVDVESVTIGSAALADNA
jgi:hypothetical protein